MASTNKNTQRKFLWSIFKIKCKNRIIIRFSRHQLLISHYNLIPKVLKKLVYLLLLTGLLIACQETKKEKQPTQVNTEQSNLAANYKNIEVVIEGMTCEIGCAKLIESKLSKTDGISYSKVVFEEKKGQITYDTNKLTKEDISKKIAGIAGGDLYSVSKTTEIPEITKTSK